MTTLGLEMSSGKGSIALIGEGENLFVREFANDRKHSGLFFENLQLCLGEFGNPARIAVGLGPGSYAGTRIAIAAALGLQAATGAELVGLPSLCAMPTNSKDYAVIGDARRHSFFFALVNEGRCVDGPLLYMEHELAARLDQLTCPLFAAEPLAQFPGVSLRYPSALILAQLATTRPISAIPLEPLYLREPHITQPRPA